MTADARKRTIDLIYALWKKRDVLEPNEKVDRELKTMSNDGLIECLRFWVHKDRNWIEIEADDSEAKTYRSKYDDLFEIDARPRRSKLGNPRSMSIAVSPVVFYGTGGGNLSAAQTVARRRMSFES